jgi:hypothetical protein
VPFPDDTPKGQDPQLDKALQILAAGPNASSAPVASPVSIRVRPVATIGLIPGVRVNG